MLDVNINYLGLQTTARREAENFAETCTAVSTYEVSSAGLWLHSPPSADPLFVILEHDTPGVDSQLAYFCTGRYWHFVVATGHSAFE